MDIATLLDQARSALTTDPLAALTAADQCIRAATDSEERGDEAQAWRIRGQALRALGRHADAVEAFRAGANAALAAGDRLLAAQVRLGEIDSLGMTGRSDAASALAERLERELREAGALADA